MELSRDYYNYSGDDGVIVTHEPMIRQLSDSYVQSCVPLIQGPQRRDIYVVVG